MRNSGWPTRCVTGARGPWREAQEAPPQLCLEPRPCHGPVHRGVTLLWTPQEITVSPGKSLYKNLLQWDINNWQLFIDSKARSRNSKTLSPHLSDVGSSPRMPGAVLGQLLLLELIHTMDVNQQSNARIIKAWGRVQLHCLSSAGRVSTFEKKVLNKACKAHAGKRVKRSAQAPPPRRPRNGHHHWTV